MAKTILLIGAFDSKGKEYGFARDQIVAQGCRVLAMNFGVMGTTDLFPVDIENIEVAEVGGSSLEELKEKKDRGEAMRIMSEGAAALTQKLHEEGRLDGVFAMGGSGGTGVGATAMRRLPIGVPKVILSTIATADTSAYVGSKDIGMFPSIVDISGLNRISEQVIKGAVGAICGMVKMETTSSVETKPIIAATMFGVTTPCVSRCQEQLTQKGFEVLVFHATGSGGRTMESLVDDGLVDAVLDITTTEWADEVCEAMLSAGDSRCEAPGKAGIPHLIVPGAVDMANFGPLASVPERYRDRLLLPWNPENTLMRTNQHENQEIGRILAEKANGSRGKVAFLLPLKGVSKLDAEDQKFWCPEADAALFNAIKDNVRPGIEVIEMDHNINDDAFADKAVEMLTGMID